MRKKVVKICLVPLLIAGGLLLAYQIWQWAAIELRNEITVQIKVIDSSDQPVSGCELVFRENGRRRIVPIPWWHSWMIDGTLTTVTTNKEGIAVIIFSDSFLRLEEIKHNENTISQFTSEFHHHAGSIHKQEGGMVTQWGSYSDADEPYKRKYIIIVHDAYPTPPKHLIIPELPQYSN